MRAPSQSLFRAASISEQSYAVLCFLMIETKLHVRINVASTDQSC